MFSEQITIDPFTLTNWQAQYLKILKITLSQIIFASLKITTFLNCEHSYKYTLVCLSINAVLGVQLVALVSFIPNQAQNLTLTISQNNFII